MGTEELKTELKADVDAAVKTANTVSAEAKSAAGKAVNLLDTVLRGAVGATLGSGLGAMLKTLGQEQVATSLTESSSSAKRAVDELPAFGALGGTVLSLVSAGATIAGTLAGSALSLLKPESLATTVGNGLNDILKKQAEA